ncbi:MAG: hypothetical protein AAFN77_10495 [Planctomycetota bacterium]
MDVSQESNDETELDVVAVTAEKEPLGNAACIAPPPKKTTGVLRWLCNRWPIWIILGVWMFFCGSLLTGQSVVGFRDSGNLYYPLFKAIDQTWAAGKIPLLNPYCNFGFPTVADGTSSIFYPGKLVFLLRFLNYPTRFGWYLSLHILLAAFGSYRLTRHLKGNRAGATIAALAFAFGGPVLFQVTNPIYVVSAAWLPWSLIGVWNLLVHRSWRASLSTAICCSMMILGGDPQMVYHVGLIALLSIVVTAIVELRADLRSSLTKTLHRSGLLALLVIVTSLLSAVQLLPSEQLTRRSERSGRGRLVNLYSLATKTNDRLEDFLKRDSQIVGQYQFSQPPWSLIELGIPNVSGRPFPINARWTHQLAGTDRMWFPSLYMGLLTMILAVGGLRFFSRSRRQVWISWITIMFLLGSFGWYGASWLQQEAWLLMGQNVNPATSWAAPVGGVYWWMSFLLPKYFSFRYPAKLFVVASLGIAVLAGLNINQLKRWNPWWLGGWAIGLAVFTPVVIENWGRDFFWQLKSAPPNLSQLVEFGPFDSTLAINQLYVSLWQTALLLILISAIAWNLRRPDAKRFVLSLVIVSLLVVDLAYSNHWLVAKVDSSIFEDATSLVEGPAAVATSEFNRKFTLNDDPSTSSPPMLIATQEFPIKFLESSSERRLEELIQWDRASLRAKYHLPQQTRLLGSFHSIWPERYFETVNQLSQQSSFGDPRIQQMSFDWNVAQFKIALDESTVEPIELPLFGDHGWTGTAIEQSSQQQFRLTTSQLGISNRDLQTIRLPNGVWQIELRYEPSEFYYGALISVLSWIGLGIGRLIGWFSDHRKSTLGDV